MKIASSVRPCESVMRQTVHGAYSEGRYGESDMRRATESSCEEREDQPARVSALPAQDSAACVRDRALQLGVAAAHPDPSLAHLAS